MAVAHNEDRDTNLKISPWMQRKFSLVSSLLSASFHSATSLNTKRSFYLAIMFEEIKAQKQDLRREVRARMKVFDQVNEQSEMVWEQLFVLPAYQHAKTVGLFLSMPKGEINTDLALQHAIQNGKTVYVPQVGTNFELANMDLLQCPAVENFHKSWPTNKWLIPEPPHDMDRVLAKPGDIDLLIVPGLAFDEKGGRLGQGKGYYDRFIAKMKKDHPDKPILVGVCMEPQLFGHIPTSDLDYRMDMLLVPSKMIDMTKK
jgi:5-formyltetrahydrofolate cyclo-ligase